MLAKRADIVFWKFFSFVLISTNLTYPNCLVRLSRLFWLRLDVALVIIVWAIGQKVLIKIAIHIDNSMSVAI